jgi:hypothetical protein
MELFQRLFDTISMFLKTSCKLVNKQRDISMGILAKCMRNGSSAG